MVDFCCKNRKCKAPTGFKTDGLHLYAGNVAFPIRVTMICLSCGETTSWRPVGLKASLARIETPLPVHACAEPGR
jgi:hypothetical protein